MTPAQAADASPWDGDSRSGVAADRAKARGEGGAHVLRAGVEIRLAPGWKTYWRYPGDSGVPPRFDFDAIRKCEICDGRCGRRRSASATPSGATIGYKNNVVFPLRIEPQDASKPVTLRLKLDYAVCEKLCVPVEAKAELVDRRASRGNDARRRPRPKRAVPKPHALGACRAAVDP